MLTVRAVFRALLGISGVGPRTALAVVSKLTAGDVSAALSAGDVAAFQRVPGVGKKTAQRIVIELAPICHRLRVGERLRLDVSSSSFPRFDRHPNIDAELAKCSAADARPAR